MLLELSNITKYYGDKKVTKAVDGINLKVKEGEFIGIMGPSGSGKTTLLNLIATIDTPTSGEISINNISPNQLKESKLADFRRNELGIVFQGYNLIDSLTLRENIALPMILEKKKIPLIEQRLTSITELLGISHLLDKYPYEVSGGEAQRAAIGRAIFNAPSLLLADEPTGNLDSKSAANVMELFATINKEENMTTLLVTHDPKAASYCHKVLFIRDGKIYNQIERGESQKIFFDEILDVLSYFNSTH
jgi:putative ABC transport system ATP-binding protein